MRRATNEDVDDEELEQELFLVDRLLSAGRPGKGRTAGPDGPWTPANGAAFIVRFLRLVHNTTGLLLSGIRGLSR